MKRSICLLLLAILFVTPIIAGGNRDKQKSSLPQSIPEPSQLSTSIIIPEPGNLYFDGDGGKGIRITVLQPTGKNLTPNEQYLLTLIQGSITGDLNKYSAMTVLDRQNLDTILTEQNLSLNGNYSDDEYIRIGNLTNTQYILTGSVTKAGNGYILELGISHVETGERKASFSPRTCSITELQNLTIVKEATEDLLLQMGVNLTQTGKTALREIKTSTLEAETSLSRGITAQRSGTVVEALSYYLQSSDYDPDLTEATSRLNILTANVTSGNIGENIRNDIQWRRQWVDRLKETEQYYANYIKDNPFYLVYSTNIQQGGINYQKETVELRLRISTVPNASWFATINQVMRIVKQGLYATDRVGIWGLNWPIVSINTPSPFADIQKNYAVVMEIINDAGKIIGKQTVALTYGLKFTPQANDITQSVQTIFKEVSFPAVDANEITDNLKIRIASIDGINTEQVAKQKRISILSEQEYSQTQNVQRYGMALTEHINYLNIVNGVVTAKQNMAIPEDVVIPFGMGITEIGKDAFKGKKLTSVIIPIGVTVIGDNAFYDNRLTSVIIPVGVTVIGNNAFYGSHLTNVTIPDSVTTIGAWAFSSNSLTNITISNNAITIGANSFSHNCLTSIIIPDSVASVGDFSFAYNNLTSVKIGSNVSLGSYCISYGNEYFHSCYHINGKKAGIYIYSSGGWRMR